MGERKAKFHNMKPLKTGSRFEYEISTRNLIGFRSQFQSQTSGLGVVHSLPLGYRPLGEEYSNPRSGVLISGETGQATAYSLEKAQERGVTFVDPGTPVYAGMIVGQNAKKEDIVMNVTKGKKLTNMRASAADATVKMAPAVKMSLEQCLTFLAADELLEVTPKNLRLRKRDLAAASRH
jgi:GTP-binding protein